MGIAAVALLAMQSISAFAAENVEVKFDTSEFYESYAGETDGDSWICYSLAGGAEITNGKMTVTYDKNYLTYHDCYIYEDEGEDYEGMEANLNNPKDGTTPEGEVVLVFSSANPMKAKGDLFDLYFNLKEGTKAGQKLVFTIKVDELTNNGTTVNSTVKQKTLTVLSDDEEEEDTEEETETETQKQTQQTKSTSSTNSTTAPTETTVKGANAKTGDVTQILPWIGAAVLAVLILGGLALSRKKDKKK